MATVTAFIRVSTKSQEDSLIPMLLFEGASCIFRNHSTKAINKTPKLIRSFINYSYLCST